MVLSWTWNIAFLAIVLTCILHKLTNKKKNRLPPGPKGFPIIGHLHLIGKNPHQDFFSLAKQHGPIMYMRFGLVPHIIVSSPKAAELFLRTHDLVFASRPPSQAAKYLSWDQKNMSFASYGPYWRYMRKICNLEMLSSLRINYFEPMRREELSFFIRSIKTDARARGAVDLSEKVSSLAVDMSCMMIFGKKYEETDINDTRGFKRLIQEGMRIAAVPNLGDFFPFLGILDFQGLTKKMKEVNKRFDDFFEMIIDDHVRRSGDHSQEDIVDTLLSIMQSGESEFQFDRGHVKSIIMDMLAGSMDTVASAIEWSLSELIKNPKVMKKVQNELERVVGFERMVEEHDLEQLEYLYMALKEIFRLHPVGPLLIPHYSMEDCTIEGYDIPKGSRLFVNIYAIGRDPETWSDPEKFFPERFIGSDVDVRGKHFQLLPFGSGRRGCPGMQLGLTQVRLVVAQLVHCFDWQLPNNLKPEKLDMTEEFGLVLARANHLMAIPTYRLSN